MNILDKSFDFEERFVAFIDILGFKEVVKTLEKETNDHELKKVKSILNFMHEETIESHYGADLPIYEQKDDKIYEKELGDPRMLYASDCMVISTEPTLDGFKILSNKIHKIITDLAVDGYFCRGAITKGKLFHHGNILFGSAYVKAYQLEPMAIYPRIIIDPDIIPFFDLSKVKVPLAPAFYDISDDNYYYLKYFTFNYYPPYLGDWIHYLLNVRTHITRNISLYFDQYKNIEDKTLSKKLLLKYQWLADEFNRNLKFYSKYLTRTIHSEEEYYKNLKYEMIEEFGENAPIDKYQSRILEEIKYEKI